MITEINLDYVGNFKCGSFDLLFSLARWQHWKFEHNI